ncbi:MAG: hypothetical protein UV74_C0013G0462 [Candidatus Woesebacteria bacterium GW2011_GWB1_43_14]|uniref:Uncharacterized protein n=1 Tax=Candidatus Woesebacteria bacterium GW2011_GWB1_43_14 TaxID=1618578 RepID=A0A0G1DHJ7_9BACT|nr:MAG: hypothetical protein UT21_C0001G0174 [Candidatus Woesebacteria bacterium GW2011_GWA1_39_11b]KKS78080.1 MAG: hypothetical protein UV51_C0003G0115 [Candidatus Woesebacteria bacterium GW2011_GWC1_42_9]KKS97340.1 MAG: hypothetical protein UV74_C0013G0462 [Candidatus Woesebacteria bacterium GW2011_GWB1_43_14]
MGLNGPRPRCSASICTPSDFENPDSFGNIDILVLKQTTAL